LHQENVQGVKDSGERQVNIAMITQQVTHTSAISQQGFWKYHSLRLTQLFGRSKP
jgi:hypothetical protein